jgi:selenocysteine lyase/cysteine desulfurase
MLCRLLDVARVASRARKNPLLPIPPLVITSTCDDATSILPWKEAGADVVYVSTEENGIISMSALEEILKV